MIPDLDAKLHKEFIVYRHNIKVHIRGDYMKPVKKMRSLGIFTKVEGKKDRLICLVEMCDLIVENGYVISETKENY